MQVFMIILFLFHVSVKNANCKAYGFEDVNPSAVVFRQAYPDGFEDLKTHLYLCRTYVQGVYPRYLPGKLYLADDHFRCVAGDERVEYSSQFQMLKSQDPGSYSWIPVAVGELPRWAVQGGSGPDGADRFACRAIYEQSLLLGNIQIGGPCKMVYVGRIVESTVDLEILVFNTYGDIVLKGRQANRTNKTTSF